MGERQTGVLTGWLTGWWADGQQPRSLGVCGCLVGDADRPVREIREAQAWYAPVQDWRRRLEKLISGRARVSSLVALALLLLLLLGIRLQHETCKSATSAFSSEAADVQKGKDLASQARPAWASERPVDLEAPWDGHRPRRCLPTALHLHRSQVASLGGAHSVCARPEAEAGTWCECGCQSVLGEEGEEGAEGECTELGLSSASFNIQ